MYVYFWQVDLCITFTLILERCPCNWVQIYWLTFQTEVIWHWNSIVHISSIPPNIRLDEDILKTSFVFVFKRLYQDEHIHLSHTSSEDVFKTSWSRPLYSSWPYVFKTSWSRPINSSWPYVFKTFSRRLQNVFKLSSRPLAKTSSKRILHFSKAYCKDADLQKDLPRSHFWDIYGQCTKFAYRRVFRT